MKKTKSKKILTLTRCLRLLTLTNLFTILMPRLTLAATELEQQFTANTLSIFWGNETVVGMVMLAMFIVATALMKVPMVIAAPIFVMSILIIAALYPAFAVIAALAIGIIAASVIVSLWRT